jgi:hypothetical protein
MLLALLRARGCPAYLSFPKTSPQLSNAGHGLLQKVNELRCKSWTQRTVDHKKRNQYISSPNDLDVMLQ